MNYIVDQIKGNQSESEYNQIAISLYLLLSSIYYFLSRRLIKIKYSLFCYSDFVCGKICL